MRRLPLAIAVALILSACGGTGTESADTAGPSSTTSADSSTPAQATAESDAPGSGEAPDATSSDSSEAPEAPSFDGPPAPDFELALSDGEVFTVSGEQKPIYMVFWAEW